MAIAEYLKTINSGDGGWCATGSVRTGIGATNRDDCKRGVEVGRSILG